MQYVVKTWRKKLDIDFCILIWPFRQFYGALRLRLSLSIYMLKWNKSNGRHLYSFFVCRFDGLFDKKGTFLSDLAWIWPALSKWKMFESCTCLAGADAAMSAGWLQSIQSQRSQAAWVERTEAEQETGRQQTFPDKDTATKNTKTQQKQL